MTPYLHNCCSILGYSGQRHQSLPGDIEASRVISAKWGTDRDPGGHSHLSEGLLGHIRWRSPLSGHAIG